MASTATALVMRRTKQWKADPELRCRRRNEFIDGIMLFVHSADWDRNSLIIDKFLKMTDPRAIRRGSFGEGRKSSLDEDRRNF